MRHVFFALAFVSGAVTEAGPSRAEDLRIEGLSPEAAPTVLPCENHPGSQENCVRVLACVGPDGLYFDGEARGWDRGGVAGTISDGTVCIGGWDSSDPARGGIARLTCTGGVTIDVTYVSQDSETGTVSGFGHDSLGRGLRVWSGLNVLAFLTPDGRAGARLPCGGLSIPIS